MVEQSAVNRWVVGSSPTSGASLEAVEKQLHDPPRWARFGAAVSEIVSSAARNKTIRADLAPILR